MSNPQQEPPSVDTKETKVIKPRSKRAPGYGAEPRLDLLSRTKRSVLPNAGKAEDVINDETIISSHDRKETDIQVQINVEEQMFTEDDVKEMRETMMDDEETAKKDDQIPSFPMEANLVLGQDKGDTLRDALSVNDSSPQGDTDGSVDNLSPDEDQFSVLDNWGLEDDIDPVNKDLQVQTPNPELSEFLNTPLPEISNTSSKIDENNTPQATVDKESADLLRFMTIIGNPLIEMTERLLRDQHDRTILLMETLEQRLACVIEDNNKHILKVLNVLYDPICKTHKILADKGNKPTQDREDIKNHISEIKVRVKRIEDSVEVISFGLNQVKANTKELVSNIYTVRESVRAKLTPTGDYVNTVNTDTPEQLQPPIKSILKPEKTPVATDTINEAINAIVKKANITRNIPLDAFLTSTIVGQRTDTIDELISGNVITELEYAAANAAPRKLSKCK